MVLDYQVIYKILKIDTQTIRIKNFCFGGSTTWGQFCEYKNTYPFYLEQLLNYDVSVYNFGGCDTDARTQIYILIDLLRKNIVQT